MFQYIDHVQIAAPENSESICREFYGTVLGMEEIPKPANLQNRGGVWFKCGAQELHIGIQADFVPATKAHPAFHVKDLITLRELLTKHRVAIKEAEPLEGALRFYVNDPFGNRLEFIERLS